METILRNRKGTRDFLPEEQRIRRQIIRSLEDTFGLYGFLPMETPILNYYDLLASKYAGGAEILKEMYRLGDQGNQELALRYDLTIPFAKVIGMNPNLQIPFKRYEIGRVFRDGPVKLGRNREFTQCDVDVAGIASVLAEAELMEMAVRVYDSLEMDVEIHYSNRKWLKGLMKAAAIPDGLVPVAIGALDKLLKTGQEAVRMEMAESGVSEEMTERIFMLLSLSREKVMTLLSSENTLIQEGAAELTELEVALSTLGVSSRTRFTPTLARGLDIYTGTVWEVYMREGEITSSVGAGGRYDCIIGAFLGNGREYPAVGMTFGLDVIYEVLTRSEQSGTKWADEVVFLPLGTQQICMSWVKILRDEGIPASMDMSGRKLKQALRDAGRRRIPYVVLIGEDELVDRKAKVRDMAAGVEKEIPIVELVAWLKKSRTSYWDNKLV